MSENKKNESPELAAAELRKAEAEAFLKELEVEKELRNAKAAKKHAKKQKDKDRFYRSADSYYTGIYRFVDAVNYKSVDALKDYLRIQQEYNPGKPLRIEFNSPGGSVIDGWELFDAIRETSDAGHEIMTVVTGRAASMAGVLVQAGDTRMIEKNAYLHLHQVSAMTYGKLEDMQQDQKFYERLNKQLCDIYAKRSGGKVKSKDVAAMIKGQEVNLDAAEALKLGFVDGII